MTGLFILLLLFLAVIYGISFGVFKLIWILFKKKRNFWPLILAGISTFLICVLCVVGIWWAAQRMITPFKPLFSQVQNHPEQVFGPQLYHDTTFPFELTVFDGMTFSDWITLKPVNIKIGLDTNYFKKANTDEEKPFLLATFVRYTQADSTEPFEEIKKVLETKDRRLQIQTQTQTTINGLPAYLIKAIAYSNQGPLQAWLGAYHTGKNELFYLLFLAPDDKNEAQVQEMLQSFRLTQPEIESHF